MRRLRVDRRAEAELDRVVSGYETQRVVRARARLVSSAISERSKARHWHVLERARGLVRVRSGGGWGGVTPRPSNARGKISVWSERSKARFRDRLACLNWPQAPVFLATATYPGEYPHDPKVWKADLHRLFVAWRRKWGPVRCVWILEFQRRGAPHFHIAIVAPAGVKSAELREWYAQTWYRIAGNGDRRHLTQHRKAEHFKRADGHQGVTAYFQRELRKEHQKQLPQWLQDQADGAGRWWNDVGLERLILAESVTDPELHKLQRVMTRVQRQRDAELEAKLKTDQAALIDDIFGRGGTPTDRQREDSRRIVKSLRSVITRRAWPGWKWRGMRLYDRTRTPWGAADEMLWYLRLCRDEEPPPRGSLRAMELRATEQLRIGPPITALPSPADSR